MSPGKPRRPPAYQEYASDLLGLEKIRLMSLAERGLFHTLRLHMWANDSAPAEVALMARTLGLDLNEVKVAYTDRVRSFFVPLPGDETRIHDPELAGQMANYLARRTAFSAGGHRGGRSTQKRQASIRAQAEARPEARLQARLEGRIEAGLKPPEKRRNELGREKTSLQIEGNAEWVGDYEKGDSSESQREVRDV